MTLWWRNVSRAKLWWRQCLRSQDVAGGRRDKGMCGGGRRDERLYGGGNGSGATMWLEVGETEDCMIDAMYQ